MYQDVWSAQETLTSHNSMSSPSDENTWERDRPKIGDHFTA